MSKNDPYTRDEDVRFTLRMPKDLMDWVKSEAETNKRSCGKQIEFILESYRNEQHSKE